MQPVRRGPRIASRTTTAHRPPRSAHRLVSFRLVRGTNFSKIPYRYIFIPDIFMAHPSYWLRCENLICGPRFDSGTSRVIVDGPRRRPCCNDDFTTAEKWHVLACRIVCLVRGDVRVAWQRGFLNSCLFIYEPHGVKTVRWFCLTLPLFVGEGRTLFIKKIKKFIYIKNKKIYIYKK